MIPVSLTIKGLYSYQKEQTIEFGKLLDGQLFGIFGMVGSGKSTILEAISYALYGDTERLNKTNDNRNYNMMNLKSNELLIDFIFRNYDEVLYRFIVRGKRNSKNFDKVDKLDRKGYKQVNGEWEPLESNSGEKIIGLSYDNFRRTIIIPQGKFQEFLQLGDSDRTRMLKEIFQLDKYEFFYQTTALEKRNNEELQRLGGQLSTFGLVTAEDIAKSTEEFNLERSELQLFKIRLAKDENQLKELENLKQLHDAFRMNETELNLLSEKKPYYEKLRNQIADFNYCVLHFKENLNKEIALSVELEKIKHQQNENIAALDKVNKSLKNNEEILFQVKSEFDKTDTYRRQLNDYDIAVASIALQKEIALAAERVKNGTAELQKVVSEITVLKNDLDEKTAFCKQLKARIPDFSVLADIRLWYSVLKNEKQQEEREEAVLRKIKAQQDDLKNEFKRLITHELFVVEPDSLGEAKIFIEEQKSKNTAEIEQLKSQLTNYEVQLKLGEYSSELHSGKPCPLCGSVEHPDILKVEDVYHHVQEHRQQVYLLHEKEILLNNFLRDIDLLLMKSDRQKEELFVAEEKLKTVKQRLSQHQSAFKWVEYNANDESLLIKRLEEAEVLKKELEQLENDMESLSVKLKETEDKHQRFKTGIDKIQREVDVKTAEISLRKSQFTGNNYEELIILSVDELIKSKELLNRHIVEIQDQFTSLQDKVGHEKQQQASLTAKIESYQQQITDNELALKMTALQLEKSLSESKYQHIEEVKDIVNQQTDFALLESELKNFDLQIYNLQQKNIELKKQLDSRVFDENVFQELKQQVMLLREQYLEKNKELAKAEARLKQQEDDYQRKISIQQQINKLEARRDNIAVLKNMFKGSGFVSYISGVYLNQLCASANKRFYKLSRQQLSLEVTEKNDFQVRDYLNDGKVRSVKTLSGGQTFQASLSLALALAESVQQQNKSEQNFFFLDEGFGSLDKESLQVAFETLKSLRKENRIVGVISHVEELQQEIDVFLKVNNDAIEGSTIKASWE